MDEGGGRGQAKGGGEGPFLVETTAPTRVQQLGGCSMQMLSQMWFLISCLYCSMNTAHIFTLHR